VREQQRELVAADPVGTVARAGRAQDAREHPEDRISLGVSVAVVDQLEVVDVQQDQGERVAVASG
jgi:hypothetical protein